MDFRIPEEIVRNKKLTNASKLAYAVMNSFKEANTITIPVETIAFYIGGSKRAVARSRIELKKAKLIEKHPYQVHRVTRYLILKQPKKKVARKKKRS